MGDRLAAGLRTLTPPTKVRILVPQPSLAIKDKFAGKFRSHRLAVRTLAFHVGNRGSSPLGITIHSEALVSPTGDEGFFLLVSPLGLPVAMTA